MLVQESTGGIGPLGERGADVEFDEIVDETISPEERQITQSQ